MNTSDNHNDIQVTGSLRVMLLLAAYALGTLAAILIGVAARDLFQYAPAKAAGMVAAALALFAALIPNARGWRIKPSNGIAAAAAGAGTSAGSWSMGLLEGLVFAVLVVLVVSLSTVIDARGEPSRVLCRSYAGRTSLLRAS